MRKFIEFQQTPRAQMTTSQGEALGDAELESVAGRVIGKIVFAFSRFEFNLGLCLRNAVGGSDVDAVMQQFHIFTD